MKIYYITEERYNRFLDRYELVGIVYMTLKEDKVMDMLSTFRNIAKDSNFEYKMININAFDEFIDKELVEDKRVYAYLNNNKE